MGAGDEESAGGERGGVLMAEDAKALWEKYYVLTLEMQKFLNREDVDDEDFHDFMDKLEKFRVYPVLNFRIYYKLF